MRRVSFGAPLRVRRITAGPTMGSPNCIGRAATPRRRARRKQNSRRAGSAIVTCWNYPSCDAHPAFDLRPATLRPSVDTCGLSIFGWPAISESETITTVGVRLLRLEPQLLFARPTHGGQK